MNRYDVHGYKFRPARRATSPMRQEEWPYPHHFSSWRILCGWCKGFLALLHVEIRDEDEAFALRNIPIGQFITLPEGMIFDKERNIYRPSGRARNRREYFGIPRKSRPDSGVDLHGGYAPDGELVIHTSIRQRLSGRAHWQHFPTSEETLLPGGEWPLACDVSGYTPATVYCLQPNCGNPNLLTSAVAVAAAESR